MQGTGGGLVTVLNIKYYFPFAIIMNHHVLSVLANTYLLWFYKSDIVLMGKVQILVGLTPRAPREECIWFVQLLIASAVFDNPSILQAGHGPSPGLRVSSGAPTVMTSFPLLYTILCLSLIKIQGYYFLGMVMMAGSPLSS